MEYKPLLGAIAVFIALLSYIPYFTNMFRGKTKPHAFSWFLWGLLAAIAFAGQWIARGGAGSWVTGFTALACFVISSFAFSKGDKSFNRLDWFCLIGALSALALWFFTNDPVRAVILTTFTGAVAFVPTFRKGYFKPEEETILTFVMSSTKFIFGLFALQSLTLTTVLYPSVMLCMNAACACMLALRRGQLRK